MKSESRNVLMAARYVVVVLMFVATSSSPVLASKTSLASMYPGPWKSDFNGDIARTLGQKNIRGCGQFDYRQNKNEPSGYLVRCTSDGKNYLYYTVWTLIKKVRGPYTSIY